MGFVVDFEVCVDIVCVCCYDIDGECLLVVCCGDAAGWFCGRFP